MSIRVLVGGINVVSALQSRFALTTNKGVFRGGGHGGTVPPSVPKCSRQGGKSRQGADEMEVVVGCAGGNSGIVVMSKEEFS